jgi:hypothetical protein
MSAPDQSLACSTSAWIHRARTAIDTAASAWPRREVQAVKIAFRALARVIRARAGRTIRLPLALPAPWLTPLYRLPAHQAWAVRARQTALDRMFTTLVDAGLLRPPARLRVRAARRLVAADFTDQVLVTRSAVRALRRTILTAPVVGDAAAARVIRAVLGLVLFSAVTRPDLLDVLAVAPASALDLDRGTLILRPRGASTSDFSDAISGNSVTLTAASQALWDSMRLAVPPKPIGIPTGHRRLLPAPWDQPAVLRAVLDHELRKAGVPGWSAFLAAVRVDLLLDGCPPLLIAHRADKVLCAIPGNARAHGILRPNRPQLRSRTPPVEE